MGYDEEAELHMAPTQMRLARKQDVAGLEDIERRAWGPGTTPSPLPPDPCIFGSKIPLEDTLVALVDNKVVGYVAIGRRIPIEANRHVGRILAVAVAPEARRRGIGRALLQAAETEARARGFRKLMLTVLGTNQAAIALYESLGYSIEARLVDEFELDGKLVDDLFMAKRLPESSPP